MRVLFTVHPMTGHFHSMVPLALALKEGGHEVAFATGAGFGPAIRGAGFMHFSCGFDFDGSKDIFEALPEWGSIQARFPSSYAIQQLVGFIQGLAPRMVEDLIPLVDVWKPDLIVRDPVEYGGCIASERAGLPYATITWAIYIAAQLYCPEPLLELRYRYGLTRDADLQSLDRYFVLNFLPPSWTFPDSPVGGVTHRFCAPPFDGSGDAGLPDWTGTLPDRPTVYVTLGTTFNQSPGTFQAVLDALGREDINVVMTVGRSMDPAQFGSHPDHIQIARYIPQSLLLSHCDAMLFHGGYNSLFSGLWHGLPMVIIPLGAGDQEPNAQRCAEMGVGVIVGGHPPEPAAIRSAVRSVLEQPEYRQRAQQLQREMKALPPLSEAVRGLELLVKVQRDKK
jgi:UDP:flavonoid glycosyltransferase YjiC (YdhE family)